MKEKARQINFHISKEESKYKGTTYSYVIYTDWQDKLIHRVFSDAFDIGYKMGLEQAEQTNELQSQENK